MQGHHTQQLITFTTGNEILALHSCSPYPGPGREHRLKTFVGWVLNLWREGSIILPRPHPEILYPPRGP